MTPHVIEARVWSRRKWFTAIALVVAIQTLLIFLLENRSPAAPRKVVAASDIRWLETISLAPLAVSDPTLFVLPHREGFSGEAWLNRVYSPDFSPPVVTEKPRLLPLSAEMLGASFKEFVAANLSPAFQAVAGRSPALDVPELIWLETPAAKSELKIEGPLKNRKLLSPVELQAWTNSDVLSNSIVQVLVNARGNVISAVLRQSCGLKNADDDALEISRSARFESSAGDPNFVTVGALIFDWQTIPALTNAPPIQ